MNMRGVSVALVLWATAGQASILGEDGLPRFFSNNAPHRCPIEADGQARLTWESGSKRLEGVCREGLMVGAWAAWHPGGGIWWRGRLEAGRFQGAFTAWHPTGETRAKVRYVHGRATGPYDAWWPGGARRAHGEMVAGRRVGCWRTWHEGGQPASQGAYARGERVETWLRWSADGVRRTEVLGGQATEGACPTAW